MTYWHWHRSYLLICVLCFSDEYVQHSHLFYDDEQEISLNKLVENTPFNKHLYSVWVSLSQDHHLTSMEALSVNCPNLEYLHITSERWHFVVDLNCVRFFPRLKYLTIIETQYDENSYQAFSHLKCLVSLCITIVFDESPKQILGFSSRKQILGLLDALPVDTMRELILRPQASDVIIVVDGFFESLCRFRNLETFSFQKAGKQVSPYPLWRFDILSEWVFEN